MQRRQRRRQRRRSGQEGQEKEIEKCRNMIIMYTHNIVFLHDVHVHVGRLLVEKI